MCLMVQTLVLLYAVDEILYLFECFPDTILQSQSSVSMGGTYVHKTNYLRQDRTRCSDRYSLSLSEHVLQDYMGVLVSWNLGVSPSWALQHCWPDGLLLF